MNIDSKRLQREPDRLLRRTDRHEITDQFSGAGVPSDHVATQIMKIVAPSSGSFAAITGELGRFAPQFFSASPGTKNIRCGCQLSASSVRY